MDGQMMGGTPPGRPPARRVIAATVLSLALAWAGGGVAADHDRDDGRRRSSWSDRMEFRAIDGTGNNEGYPFWGSAGSELLRAPGTADYDGVSGMAGAHRPSARAISNVVAAQPGPLPNASGVSAMFWQWGQFLDHDIDLTVTAVPPEPANIPVPLGDPFFDPFGTGSQVIPFTRSAYDPLTSSPYREQVNEVTAYIDASHVYGSDAVRADALRDHGGRLKMSKRRLLPFNVDGLPNAPSPSAEYFLAGDVRANEQVGLTAMHTLFVREHNRLVRLLRRLRLPPETRYQVARALVAAEIQAITYREFLPVLLGPNVIPPYSGYDPSVNAGISNVFSTAAYRFGHSMVSSTLWRLRRNGRPIKKGHLPLREAFFDPKPTLEVGIEPVLRGLAHQRAETLDTFVVDDLRNFLFGPPGAGGFDLASLNLQRGRDHGLSSYNDAREHWGMPRATSFADVTSSAEVQSLLASAYGSVDDVDLWVGGLAEDPVPEGLVGSLFCRIIADQFIRLRDGDRFYYERLPRFLVRYVERLDLRTLIRINTRINRELPREILRSP